ncbi:MAG: hypothetical protein U0Y68_15865 [Blastocatellia bacterium]
MKNTDFSRFWQARCLHRPWRSERLCGEFPPPFHLVVLLGKQFSAVDIPGCTYDERDYQSGSSSPPSLRFYWPFDFARSRNLAHFDAALVAYTFA